VADIWTKKKRSEVMSLIRGKGNKETENALLTLLRQNKITGWRRHLPLPRKPDFAFPKQKLAVFVDGWLMAFASLQTVPPLWGYLR
jgi:DNA mismatch endonuclease (patch repair protein)